MRRAIALVGLTLLAPAARPADVTFLPQGWEDPDRQAYYYLPQGSELMPYPWFLALEQPWADKPFRDDAHLESFRFIPGKRGKAGEPNPDGLPVGFANGRGKDGRDWLGLTCAACHTGQFTYRGKAVRVDGGTTLADMLGFQSGLVQSLRATLVDRKKFDRFANKVLGNGFKPAEASKLEGEVREQLRVMADWEATSRPAHPGGFGVWDALGVLLNTITATATGTPDNYRVPHTPVSYPSIWLTTGYDRLLWNASVRSITLRQVGEVIIVFGRAKAHVGSGKSEFESSADLAALYDIYYKYTDNLLPPKWPEEVLGKIDRDLAATGRKVYVREQCATCHPLDPYPTVELKPGGRKLIKVTATPVSEVKTDPLYAEYFVKRTAVPGPLAPLFDKTMFKGQKQVPAAIQFLATLKAITEADLDRAANGDAALRAKLLGDRPLPELPASEKELDALVGGLLAYKATPLAGVWATAPYLHNGSVPTLHDLLLPAARRPKAFHLGDREFDPERVGYRTAPSAGSYRYDTTLPGFSNGGHEYGAKLNDADRRALLEFLKTL